MSADVKFLKTPAKTTKAVIFGLYEGTAATGPDIKALGKEGSALIARALASHKTFHAKTGEVLELSLPESAGFETAFLLGLGKPEDLSTLKAEEAGGKLYPALKKAGIQRAALFTSHDKKLKSISAEALGAHIAAGVKLRAYAFDAYKSKTPKAKNTTPTFETLEVISPNQVAAKKAFEELSPMIEGTFWARNLVNEPPNTLYPDAFAQILKTELKPLGVDIEILDEKKMQKLGMGAILAVGMGSARPPRMVLMRWNGLGAANTGKGAKKSAAAKPLALVGKGVTFDTGGISLKPGAGMEEMKMDMGGAAAVAGTIKALALRKAKVNVVGIVGLAENMPSAEAYRPGDIITSHAGKTIEVLNTDAEGRLVLADCLSYVQKTCAPHTIIDLATLTGAMIVALGHEYCGTFANDDALWSQMEQASAKTGEKLWRMPLDDLWKKEVESEVADIQNLGKSGRGAGSCTAAGFLHHFIEDGTHWAHMDIAGTAWRKSDQPTVPKFGTGFGVRVLSTLIADHYE
ncbi:MAG: leucyl aminopeptidase [Alphaproteobacteria bacterium]|nr:leucyl aminopeptidase [Alphaproteobacteria bacterium]